MKNTNNITYSFQPTGLLVIYVTFVRVDAIVISDFSVIVAVENPLLSERLFLLLQHVLYKQCALFTIESAVNS